MFVLTFTVQSSVPSESYSSPSGQSDLRERMEIVRFLIKLEAGSHKFEGKLLL